MVLGACGGSLAEPLSPADGGVPPVIDGGVPTDGGTDGGSDGGVPTDGGTDGGVPTDGGTDGGVPTDGGTDGGVPTDGGTDGGVPTDGGTDGGVPTDGGTDGGLTTITFPNSAGWTFYGPQNGGPQDAYDISMDDGGNIWVAGGTEGLFVLKAGATRLQKFGIADGLHPYGYLSGAIARYRGVPDGTPADPSPSLSATPVVSVAGGPAGTVFVGYQGKLDYQGKLACESEWDSKDSNHELTNPAIYKSGDADKVTLSGAGINVVHYDIYSGEGVVGFELAGREKLCSIYRIVYDRDSHVVWFGGNHGFAMGNGDFAGNPTCNGQLGCAGVWEHVHPIITGCTAPGTNCTLLLSDNYYGIAKDPISQDEWVGGQIRTTKFHVGTYNKLADPADNKRLLTSWAAATNGYYQSESDTEDWGNSLAPGACTRNRTSYPGVPCGMENRFDIWPDRVGEWDTVTNQASYPSPADRKDDSVSGIAALSDGTAWVSSFAYGLAHLDAYGNVLGTVTAPTLINNNLSGLALDPADQSLWAGGNWGYGINRYHPATGSIEKYSTATFGDQLVLAPIGNIQAAGVGTSRKILVAFHRNGNTAGAIGIFVK